MNRLVEVIEDHNNNIVRHMNELPNIIQWLQFQDAQREYQDQEVDNG